MPTFTFTKSDTTEDTVDELISRMSWLTSRLDSKNVKRLDTNETLIKSADGTTYINGPILEQRDSSGTLRLAQGYDSSSDLFGYALYNKLGVQTFGLDSNGNAVYAGTIEANQINASTLSAITANLGTITAGSISGTIITSINPTYDAKAIMNSGSLTFARKTTGFEFGSVGTDSQLNLLLEGTYGVLISSYSSNDITLNSSAYVDLYGPAGVRANGATIATQSWVTGLGYATKSWVTGKGYLTESDADDKYVSAASLSNLCDIDATSTGIAIRDKNGNLLGVIGYD